MKIYVVVPNNVCDMGPACDLCPHDLHASVLFGHK